MALTPEEAAAAAALVDHLHVLAGYRHTDRHQRRATDRTDPLAWELCKLPECVSMRRAIASLSETLALPPRIGLYVYVGEDLVLLSTHRDGPTAERAMEEHATATERAIYQYRITPL